MSLAFEFVDLSNPSLIQHAVINATASGANTVVSGVSGKSIRVFQYSIDNNDSTNDVVCTWESSSGLIIGGPMRFKASGGIATPWNPCGHFKDTLLGEDLVLFLSGAIVVGGQLSYVFV